MLCGVWRNSNQWNLCSCNWLKLDGLVLLTQLQTTSVISSTVSMHHARAPCNHTMETQTLHYPPNPPQPNPTQGGRWLKHCCDTYWCNEPPTRETVSIWFVNCFRIITSVWEHRDIEVINMWHPQFHPSTFQLLWQHYKGNPPN